MVECGKTSGWHVKAGRGMHFDSCVRASMRCLHRAFRFVIALLSFAHAADALDPSRPPSQYVHRVWLTDDGLPQNTVTAIVQTHDGYLWLGTQDGLARFDGVAFTVFDRSNTNGMAGNHVTALYEDRRRTLWIGTRSGLTTFANGRFNRFTLGADVPAESVEEVIEDSEGRIWIGTVGRGLIGIEEGSADRPRELRVPFPRDVSAICEGPDGDLWLGSSSGLFRMHAGVVREYGIADGFTRVPVRAIAPDRNGNLWIGTDKGIARYRDGRFAFYTTRDGLSSDLVTALLEDRDGNIWISTESGGVSRLANGRFSTFDRAAGLSGNGALALMEDRERSLWIGTYFGLNQLRDGKIVTYTTADGLPDNFVWGICEDQQGALWISTNGGLSRYQNGEFRNFGTRDGLSSALTTTAHSDRQGNVWVGTYDGGLNRLRDGRFEVFSTANGFTDKEVRCFAEGADGSLWIGTAKGGLYRYRDGRFETVGDDQGLSETLVLSMCVAPDRTLWLGLGDGRLLSYAGGRFRTYAKGEGMPGDRVLVIHRDAEGVVWIGTEGGGLLRLRHGQLVNYTTAAGLIDSAIFAVVEDASENLWLSSNRGLSCISKRQLNEFAEGKLERVVPLTFGTDDGMRSREGTGGYQSTGCRTRDGRLWFATTIGIVLVDPKRLHLNPVAPPVHIERIALDGFDEGWQHPVYIKPGVGKVEISYTALSFVSPGRVRLKYQLAGFDRDWTGPRKDRSAVYTNIPPGRYTFQVTACNSDGVWNDTGDSIGIIVLPPIWRTWWFILFALLAFSGLSYIIIHSLRRYLSLIAFWKKQKCVGHYQLTTKIATGGMGTVYRAVDLMLRSRIVALKLMNEELATDEKERKRLRREAFIIDQLDHPNVVKVVERGEHEQRPYVAMELLAGVTLSAKIAAGGFSDTDASLHVMIQIASALANIHSKDIIHRDLKPDNIMLVTSGEDPNFVKLLDFGLARMQSSTRLTQTGTMVGTLYYMSPEQVRGKPADSRSDVYMLGVLFYELLTLRRPFEADTPVGLIMQVLESTPLRPTDLAPNLPVDLERLILAMIDRDPESRPSAQEVLRELERVRAGRGDAASR
ncbi:MAG: two-component regulator propeller domain-containing protein [Acidobacteriota bacterium]